MHKLIGGAALEGQHTYKHPQNMHSPGTDVRTGKESNAEAACRHRLDAWWC